MIGQTIRASFARGRTIRQSCDLVPILGFGCLYSWVYYITEKAGAKAPTVYQVFSALIKSAIAFKAFLLAFVSDSVSASVKPKASPM